MVNITDKVSTNQTNIATNTSSISTNIPSSLGTAGQVLTVNAGATAGEWADAGGGAWSLVSSATASGDAFLEFSFQSGAAQHAFIFSQLIPSNNASNLMAQMRKQSTGTYSASTGDYSWTFFYHSATADTMYSLRGESVASLTFLYNVSNSASGGGISGQILFDDPFAIYDSTCSWNLSSSYSTGLYGNHAVGGGTRMEPDAHDRIKFYMSAGSLTSGTIYYYALSSS